MVGYPKSINPYPAKGIVALDRQSFDMWPKKLKCNPDYYEV